MNWLVVGFGCAALAGLLFLSPIGLSMIVERAAKRLADRQSDPSNTGAAEGDDRNFRVFPGGDLN